MLPQKNVENINKIIEKYEAALQKIKTVKSPKTLDANNMCRNIIVMYNDVVVSSYNLYSIMRSFIKSPSKQQLQPISNLFEKIKASQCQFIDITVNNLLKAFNIPLRVSNRISKRQYVYLMKAIHHKAYIEKITQQFSDVDDSKRLKLGSFLEKLTDPSRNNSPLYHVKAFADDIAKARPQSITNYVSSDPSKFIDYVLAFCLSYTNYIDSIINSMNLISKTKGTKDSEIAEFFSDYIEFFQNVTKTKKEISPDTCNDLEKVKNMIPSIQPTSND